MPATNQSSCIIYYYDCGCCAVHFKRNTPIKMVALLISWPCLKTLKHFTQFFQAPWCVMLPVCVPVWLLQHNKPTHENESDKNVRLSVESKQTCLIKRSETAPTANRYTSNYWLCSEGYWKLSSPYYRFRPLLRWDRCEVFVFCGQCCTSPIPGIHILMLDPNFRHCHCTHKAGTVANSTYRCCDNRSIWWLGQKVPQPLGRRGRR